MSSDATVTLDLGAEELLVLLSALRVGTLPGLGEDPTAGLNEDQIQRARAAGLNALRARGWVQVEAGESGPKITLDSTLAALLLTCATAKEVVFLSRMPVDGPPVSGYLHCGPHLFVIHAVQQPGVHRFIGTIARAEALACINEMLHLDHQAAPAIAGLRINNDVLDRVTAAIQEGNSAEGMAVFIEQGASSDLARQIAESISNLYANSMVAVMHLDLHSGTSFGEGFALLEGPSGFWMLETQAETDSHSVVMIHPISAESCQERIEAMIPMFDSANPRI